MTWSDPSRKAKPSHHSDCVKPAQRQFVLHRPGGLGAVPACKVEQPSIDPQDTIMSEETARLPRTVVALDVLLLGSKLSVPQPRPGSVSRAGLIEAAHASGCRVIGVTAPAGYGKSTFTETSHNLHSFHILPACA